MTEYAGVAEAVAHAHRHEWARVLAATVRVARDLDLAEECTQDAYAKALSHWAANGVPDRPGAWLTTVARNRARDLLRRESVLRSALPLLVMDDVVAGPEDVPDPQEVADDLLRLIFTCCHPALSHDAQVALTLRLVCGLSTTEGAALLTEVLRSAGATRYSVQAAIVAVHTEAARWEDTDWVEVAGLYDVLRRLWPSPVVELNRAVAIGYRDGPEAGLAALSPLQDEPALSTYGYLSAARADFLSRLGRWADAATSYEEALAMTGNEVERAFMARRLEEVAAHLD